MDTGPQAGNRPEPPERHPASRHRKLLTSGTPRRQGQASVLRTLPAYFLRQTLATLAVSVGVFTALLLVGSVLREALELLNSRTATVGLLVRAIGLLIPFVLAFSMPIGFLTATLLTLGRLSADQEITAARAGGLSLTALSAPLIAAAALFSVLCGWLNLEVAPRCRTQFKVLRDSLLESTSGRFVAENRFIELSPNLTLYAHEAHGAKLTDVLVFGVTNSGPGVSNMMRTLDVWAPAAELKYASNGTPSALVFTNLQGLIWSDGAWRSFFSKEYTQLIQWRAGGPAAPRLSDMTFFQLLAERRRLAAAAAPLTPVDVQIHRQLAFSAACVGFALIGIPLGVRAHRRETNIGVAISLGLVLVYYAFQIAGQALDTKPEWHPTWVLWAPNVLFQVVGAALLWRADRRA